MSAGCIRRRGDAWEIRFEAPRGPDGKRRTRTKLIKGSKRAARQALRAALGAVDRGEAVEPSKVTITEHVRGRIAHWQASGRVTTRTAEHYGDLARLIETGLGAVVLHRLTTLDVEQWHLALLGRKLAPRTLRAAHALLTRALADAQRHQLISRNPARDQSAPAKEPGGKVAAPHAEQCRALLVALEGDPWWRVRVLIALKMGLRRSEMLALHWNDIDLERGTLMVRWALEETRAGGIALKEPKTPASRRLLSLPSSVLAALRDHRRAQLEQCLLLGRGRPADDAPVFAGDDGGYDGPRAFSARWGRRAARLGMASVTWHMLRHACASALIAQGTADRRGSMARARERCGHNARVRTQVHDRQPGDRAGS